MSRCQLRRVGNRDPAESSSSCIWRWCHLCLHTNQRHPWLVHGHSIMCLYHRLWQRGLNIPYLWQPWSYHQQPDCQEHHRWWLLGRSCSRSLYCQYEGVDSSWSWEAILLVAHSSRTLCCSTGLDNWASSWSSGLRYHRSRRQLHSINNFLSWPKLLRSVNLCNLSRTQRWQLYRWWLRRDPHFHWGYSELRLVESHWFTCQGRRLHSRSCLDWLQRQHQLQGFLQVRYKSNLWREQSLRLDN